MEPVGDGKETGDGDDGVEEANNVTQGGASSQALKPETSTLSISLNRLPLETLTNPATIVSAVAGELVSTYTGS